MNSLLKFCTSLVIIIIFQDDIIPQTEKDDDTQAVTVHEEAAKPFFIWPFGDQTASKNKEKGSLQQATTTKEPLMQTVRLLLLIDKGPW